jgi:hypothetical protein
MPDIARRPSNAQDEPAEHLAAILLSLFPDLAQLLARLDGVPERLAERIVATLPLGSRCALIAYGIAEDHREPGTLSPEIKITPHGWRVVRACALAHPRTQAQRQEGGAALVAARRERHDER